MATYIYGLACPYSGEIRYIGKSTNPKRRFRAHIGAALRHDYDHHTARWIRSIIAKDEIPVLFLLQVVGPDEDWRDVERKHIADAIGAGCRLTNSTIGGEGLDYIDPEDHQKYLRNLKVALEKYRATPEGQEQFRNFVKASRTPEAAEARRQSIIIKYQDPDCRAKFYRINKEIVSRPEVKKKKSIASKAMWRDDNMRAHFLEVFSSPETKTKQSEAKIKAWADPVVGEKLRAIHSSPEVRLKKSEAAKRRATPEYRAMMADARRRAWVRQRANQDIM